MALVRRNLLPDKILRIRSNKFLLSLIALINILGFLVGLIFYRSQLESYKPIFWLLIVDSPIVTLLAGISLITLFTDRKSDLINVLASFGCLKYGFWTLLVVFFYLNTYLKYPYSSIFIVIGHVGLIIEALFILSHSEIKKSSILLSFLWFFLNDYADYFLNLHPYLPTEKFLYIIAISNLILTFSITIYLLWLNGYAKNFFA